MVVFTNVDWDDENQRHSFFNDLIAEQPDSEKRKTLLEEAEQLISDLAEQNDQWETAIEEVRQDRQDIEMNYEDEVVSLQGRLDEVIKAYEKETGKKW